MSKAVLKLVEAPQQYREEIELPESRAGDLHSFHSSLIWPESPQPELAAELLHRFSHRGDTVLDPFAKSGVFALQAALSGRVVIAADAHPLSRRIVAAKLQPAELTEVALGLQMINFRGPVDLRGYQENFAPFYDVDTYRELVNLRSALRGRSDHVSSFIELLTLGVLHGHTAGYLSTYTFPQVALTPAEQISLNDRRSQRAEHRSVSPRILRKTAAVLRDGVPGGFRRVAAASRVLGVDPRQLTGVTTGEVGLVLTAPPTPHAVDRTHDQWLRSWFCGVSASAVPGAPFEQGDVSGWCDFMNESLVELGRVVRPRGRVVLDLPETVVEGEEYRYDEILNDVVVRHLGRIWDWEGTILYRKPASRSRDCVRQVKLQFGDRNRILVLKRR